jgi:hypothetical protein
MTDESLEGDIPPDAGPDAARETSSDTGAFDPGSVAGGAGEGVPGAPAEPGHEPGRGPTSDEATGITGESGEEDDATT